jgi:hypothetical protein
MSSLPCMRSIFLTGTRYWTEHITNGRIVDTSFKADQFVVRN